MSDDILKMGRVVTKEEVERIKTQQHAEFRKNNAVKSVKLRGGFSDRNKIRQESISIQLTSFDICSRTNFMNIIRDKWDAAFTRDGYQGRTELESCFIHNAHEVAQFAVKQILQEVYVEATRGESFIDPCWLFSNFIEKTVLFGDYDEVLTLVEFLANMMDSFVKDDASWSAKFNKAFEYDFVGYRFVNDEIVAITDDNEIKAIEEAVQDNPYEKCRTHLSKALSLLADREKKDYSNSIKESISAVENICQIIVGKSTTLGDALKQLESKGIKINTALKAAFEKMYGYTSGAGGIRHANASTMKCQPLRTRSICLWRVRLS